MKTPNKYIMILFIFALLYAMYQLILTPKNKKNVSKYNEEIKSFNKELLLEKSTAKGSTLKSEDEGTFAKEQRSKMLAMGRNPFLYPEDIDPYIKSKKNIKGEKQPLESKDNESAEEEETLLNIKVSAILISGKGKVATINQPPFVLAVGDWVQNEQVLDIKSDRIILGKNGIKREIFLEFPDIGH